MRVCRDATELEHTMLASPGRVTNFAHAGVYLERFVEKRATLKSDFRDGSGARGFSANGLFCSAATRRSEKLRRRFLARS